jgi:chromate transporter
MVRVLQLFWDLFRLSLFVVGGGYAMIAVADDVFAKRGWTKEGEIVDHLPVYQMIPGLIATHIAVFVGRRVAGLLGAAIGVAAVALPSVVIFTFVSAGYDALPLDNAALKSVFVGLRAGLSGIIAATIVRSWRRSLPDVFAYVICVAAFLALSIDGVAVPWVLVAAMVAGVVATRGGARESGCGGARESGCNAKKFCASWLPLLLFLKYGALCFGGGFVLVPMYIEDFVGPSAAFLNVTADEFANLMALTQMTPGPIGVNGATYFGFRLAGVAGAVLASAALLLPGSLLAYAVFGSLERFRENAVVRGLLRGVRPASVALMLVALWAFAKMSVLCEGGVNFAGAAIAVLSLAAMLSRRVNVVAIIALSALLGFLFHA